LFVKLIKHINSSCLGLTYLKTKTVATYVVAVQIVGGLFYAFFSAAYILAIPSIKVLSGQSIFKIPMMVFGTLFVALTLTALVIALVRRRKNSETE